MDSVNDPTVHTVVIMSSAQIGKTEIINNIIGYFIDQDPAPILLLQPTLEMAQAWSKDRLAPMLRDTPALSGKVKDPRARDSGNTILHKTFPGGHITAAGANSPASLASRPIRIVLCDEVDRFPPSAGAEGDPVNLARKRSTTFWNRKTLICSTPTVKNMSRIEAGFEDSNKQFFYVPCPDCGEMQRLLWGNVKWPEDEPEAAYYGCIECGSCWDDGARWRAISQGEWRAEKPNKGTIGFHINEIYSPWVRLGEMAEAFIEAKALPDTLKTFINTALGETWEEDGEGVDDESLKARREAYSVDALPDEILVITAGVDVQDNRLEVEIVGWGIGEESWSVEYHIIHGDPGKPDIWQQLDELLLGEYATESGFKLRIVAACVDSGGHFTNEVYRFCKPRTARRIWAIKGMAGQGRAIVGRPSRNNKAKCELFPIGVDTAKEIIYSRFNITVPGPGCNHFPLEYDDEHFAQITAEKIFTKFVKGFPVPEWRKTRQRNEALDCRVYGYAALCGLNPQFNIIAAKRKPTDAGSQKKPDEIDPPPKKRRPKHRRGRGGFVTGWKK